MHRKFSQIIPTDHELLARKALINTSDELLKTINSLHHFHTPEKFYMFRYIHNGVEFWDMVLEKSVETVQTNNYKYDCLFGRVFTFWGEKRECFSSGKLVFLEYQTVLRDGRAYFQKNTNKILTLSEV